MAARSQRSAMGVGVTTLITILVVMLLATFSVLSLVSARSDLNLSNMAVSSAQDYYAADTLATQWYASLDAFCAANASGATDGLRVALAQAGYAPSDSESGELIVSKTFPVGTKRQLTASIGVAADGSTAIRQWQISTT